MRAVRSVRRTRSRHPNMIPMPFEDEDGDGGNSNNTPAAFSPSMDFSDPRNSQYVPLLGPIGI